MAMESYVLAGGCFRCLDAVYRTLNGVVDVVSGLALLGFAGLLAWRTIADS